MKRADIARIARLCGPAACALLAACAVDARLPQAATVAPTASAPHTAVAAAGRPTARPTNTPAPTSTPTPEPTPTHTPPPPARLAAAARALFNGDYDTAVREYQSVLAGDASTEELAEALVGLGQTRLRQGNAAAAESALAQFTEQFATHERAADAMFLLGAARDDLGDTIGAVQAYQAYLDMRGDVIASYVHERIGDAHDRAGDSAAAMQAFQQAIAEAPGSSVAARQREKLALDYRLSGDNASAIDQYRTILEFAQIPTYRAHVNLLLGQTLIDSGDPSGFDVFREIVEANPQTGDAYQALLALVNNGEPVDSFQRGLVDYYAGQYDAAVAAFEFHIASTPDHADAHYYKAMAHRAAGNTGAALPEFDILIADHGRSRFWSQAWIDKAIAQSLGGDVDAAVDTLLQFATANPAAALAPESMLRAARLLERDGQYRRAAEVYRGLADAHPAFESSAEALFAAGESLYRAGDGHAALDAWRVLSDTYPGSVYYAAALLWQGKQARSDAAGNAATLFDRAEAAAPLGYYGIRAAELRDGRPLLAAMPYRLDVATDGGRVETEQWLAQWTGRTEVSGALPAAILSDGRFRRGNELWRLGWFDAAKGEFEGLRLAYRDDPAALYALSLYWRDIGLHAPSVMVAARLIALSPAGSADRAPAFMARLSYPTPYADLVTAEAAKYDLDPLLLFALMRQESLFDSIVTSSASAHGLMQIIPPTGADIARVLNWPDYQTSDLYRPYVSVLFGTNYLARMRDYYDGDLYVALAAYNGGPGNASRWQELAGGDPDLYLESISLAETRAYLMRIREHLAMYQRLYGGQ